MQIFSNIIIYCLYR